MIRAGVLYEQSVGGLPVVSNNLEITNGQQVRNRVPVPPDRIRAKQCAQAIFGDFARHTRLQILLLEGDSRSSSGLIRGRVPLRASVSPVALRLQIQRIGDLHHLEAELFAPFAGVAMALGARRDPRREKSRYDKGERGF